MHHAENLKNSTSPLQSQLSCRIMSNVKLANGCFPLLNEVVLKQLRAFAAGSCRLWNENHPLQCATFSTNSIKHARRRRQVSPASLWLRPSSCHFCSTRHFIRLPKSLIDAATGGGAARRKDYAETRLLGYSAEQMYEIVRQVDAYPSFVPWCTGARMRHRGGDAQEGSDIAVMEVGFPPISERYTSIVTYQKPHLVQSVATDGRMFKYMFTQWKFSPAQTPQTCLVDFTISFEFKNVLHSSLANLFFEEVARKMVNAFLTRANDQYGPPSLRDQRIVHQSIKS